ncbi:MAG: hypothetical protein J5I93_18835 [Pirellulaceae bacterium]|nr:hypothetical protein [Pirellulaceae bacterium]
MKLNRQQFLMIGLVVLFLGIQFRVFDRFVLTEDATVFVEQKLSGRARQQDPMTMFWGAAPPPARRTVRPPQWVGWALLSVGGVLVMHSLALKPAE